MVLPWDGQVKKALIFLFNELVDYLSTLQQRTDSSVWTEDLLIHG
jgi:hypothetical protein